MFSRGQKNIQNFICGYLKDKAAQSVERARMVKTLIKFYTFVKERVKKIQT